jgi:hypothetical protein
MMSMSSRKGNSDNCGAAILAAGLVKKKYSASSESLITYTADMLWSVWGVVAKYWLRSYAASRLLKKIKLTGKADIQN